jgi:hypothetical protein
MVQIDGESRQHTLVMELAAGTGSLTSKQHRQGASPTTEREECNVGGKNVAATEKTKKRERKKRIK